MNRRAIFTIVQDEKEFLPIWLKYYRQFFLDEDIYVLDHDTQDGSTEHLPVHRVPVVNEYSFDHQWLLGIVSQTQQRLLERYPLVVFAEADELLVPLGELIDLGNYLDTCHEPRRATGYNVRQMWGAPDLDWSTPILSQSGRMLQRDQMYDKTLISTIPLNWSMGFHEAEQSQGAPDPNLLLLHLHRIDYPTCLARHERRLARKWPQFDIDNHMGWQSRLGAGPEFEEWFWEHVGDYHL